MKTIKELNDHLKFNGQLKLKFLLSKISLVVLVLLAFGSCSKTNEFSESSISQNYIGLDGVRMEDGRLIFNDDQAFEEALKFVILNQSNIELLYTDFPDFISANMQYNLDLGRFDSEIKSLESISNFSSMTLRTLNGEQEIAPTIDAVVVSLLANSQQVFQIGDMLYYFTYDYTYKIPIEKVKISKNTFHFDETDVAEVFKVERSINTESVEGGSRAITDEFTYNYYTCAIDRRFYGNMETTDVGVYLEIRLTTKHQKKSLGIWVGEKVSYIGTSGSGKYTGPFAGDPFQYDYSANVNKYDANDANYIISGLGGLGAGDHYYFVAGECSNSHKFNKDCSGALYTNYTNY